MEQDELNDPGDAQPIANLIGFWDFLTGGETDDTGLDDGFAQNGFLENGAVVTSGQLCLDGEDDRFDVAGNDDPFDLSEGTIVAEFTQTDNTNGTFQTVVNRGQFFDAATEGYFEIRVDQDGSVVVTHAANGVSIEESTGPILVPDDTVRVTYEWSSADGGQLIVENLTTDTTETIAISQTGLDMDIGGNDGISFSIGARENVDDEYLKFFEGKIDSVAVYDGKLSVSGRDGIVSGTDGDDNIDITYTGDPDGDRVDNGDAILPGEGPDDDIIRAGDGNDTITGGAGADEIDGGADRDVIVGGNAGDAVDGGETGDDFDVLDLRDAGPLRIASQTPDADGNSTSGTIEFLDGDGNPTGTMTFTEIEEILLPTARDGIVEGTDGDDTIDTGYTGDPDGDIIDGGDAILPGEGPDDDIVDAGDGDDSIDSGAGDDDVDGGEGNDTINTGDGSDEVDGGAGNDVIDTSAGGVPLPDLGFPGYTSTDPNVPPVPADTDPDDDRDTVMGGAGDDTISTGDDADLIDGGTGNDQIDGGIDADTINAGAGNDLVIGGEGADSILAGAGNDTVYGGLDPVFPDGLNIRDDGSDGDPDPETRNGLDFIDAGAGDDLVFGQDDDDTIIGGAGNDTLDGGIDDDSIDGGTGDDVITGGQGVDTLSGGDDRDTFLGGNAGDFIDGGEGGIDEDTLDLRGAAGAENPNGTLTVELSSDNPENGTVTFFDEDGNATGTLEFINIETVIPCFTPGTMIATPTGERRVEDLEIGDRVITRDNGIQDIRWLGKRALTGQELVQAEHLRPVLIRAGALGNGLPERDMMVSPNHRVLVANDKTALYFEEREVLVAAKHLTGLDGVDVVEVSGVTYIHFMFEQHEVVLSDGAWTESFQPGDQTLAGVGDAQRNEIFELFPELKTPEGVAAYNSARRSLKKHEAHLLMN
ncbi:Hint domain-containing protein [Thalassococcus sp. S3]|uniref:Hint domain-containing protein n=1 Tax=Thalassococcus sp. S3 TaxID=2017482 RepID=UPI0010240F71|nr:Hint domain-containing protein [Thalassococcus sp. S3]QBF31656.1 type I secretion protein [Thalassococcus sp. S3]